VAVLVDHTVSGFRAGSQEELAVRLIYRQMMYASKPSPPCKEIPAEHRPSEREGMRGPYFTVREHDLCPPPKGSHKEILIYGSTQLSKTPEAACTAWCAFFVDGCVPIIGVRNKGGANSGSTDMANGIEKFNKRVEQIFHHEVRSGHLNLPEDDYVKLLLRPRKTSDGEQPEFDVNSRKLSRPQVLIICMNPSQVKNLIGGQANTKQSKAGATSGLLDIMKGNTNHPYPPKCQDPYAPFDDGKNRPVARVYFILDEDDLNRSNTSSVTERLQFNAPRDVMDKLHAGLTPLLDAARARRASSAGSSDDPVLIDSDDEPAVCLDEDVDDEATIHGGDPEEAEELAENRIRNEFKNQLDSTGIRSAVRGVVALTATPAACGHDLSQTASQAIHQICEMEHPANYVGCACAALESAPSYLIALRC
jgi:hypothetical protein